MSKRAAKGTNKTEPVVRNNPRVSARSNGNAKKKGKFGTLGILIIVAAVLIVIIAVVAIGIGCNGRRSGSSIANINDDKINVEVQTNENGETIAADSTAVEIERQNLINNNSCQVIITAIDTQNASGYTINVELVNKTDSAQMFSVKYATVDGLSIDPNWASEVAGGSSKESQIIFHKSDYASYNLGFTDIQLVFVVNDSVETSTQITQQAVRIYPYGAGTASIYTRAEGSKDVVLIDNDAIRVTYIGNSDDDVWGYSANLYIENKTGTNLWVTGNDVSVNGTLLDPFWGTTVPANSSAYTSVCWTASQLQGAGIDEVSSIEMTLVATNYDDWEALQISSEAVTINP